MLGLGDITKIASLLTIGKGIVDKVLIRKLMLGITAVIALTVIAGMLVGTIIVTLLALLYQALIHNAGVSSYGALGLVGLLTILAAAAIVYRIVQLVKRVATYTALIEQPALPPNPFKGVVEAFIDGFKNAEPRDERTREQAPKKPKKHLKPVK